MEMWRSEACSGTTVRRENLCGQGSWKTGKSLARPDSVRGEGMEMELRGRASKGTGNPWANVKRVGKTLEQQEIARGAGTAYKAPQKAWKGGVRARPRPPGAKQADTVEMNYEETNYGRTNYGRTNYGRYRLSAREWLLYGAQGLCGCALLAYVFYRSAAAFLVMAPVGALYPLYRREELKKRRLRKLNLEFKDAILVMASFLGAGYSIENAVAACGQELALLHGPDGLMAAEFAVIAEKLRFNRTVESALLELGERSGLEDVNNFAQVFTAAKRSGGDLVEIISHTAGVIRDKVQVQEEIYTMTAAKAFEQKVMSLIPILIVLYIDLTSPGFFRIMYTTAAGRCVMSACLAVYGAAVLLARRILNVEI